MRFITQVCFSFLKAQAAPGLHFSSTVRRGHIRRRCLFQGVGAMIGDRILGMLLGPEMEKSLRHALTISDGDWTILWSSGLSVGIWIVAIAGLVLPYLIGPILRRRMANEAEKAHAVVD